MGEKFIFTYKTFADMCNEYRQSNKKKISKDPVDPIRVELWRDYWEGLVRRFRWEWGGNTDDLFKSETNTSIMITDINHRNSIYFELLDYIAGENGMSITSPEEEVIYRMCNGSLKGNPIVGTIDFSDPEVIRVIEEYKGSKKSPYNKILNSPSVRFVNFNFSPVELFHIISSLERALPARVMLEEGVCTDWFIEKSVIKYSYLTGDIGRDEYVDVFGLGDIGDCELLVLGNDGNAVRLESLIAKLQKSISKAWQDFLKEEQRVDFSPSDKSLKSALLENIAKTINGNKDIRSLIMICEGKCCNRIISTSRKQKTCSSKCRKSLERLKI